MKLRNYKIDNLRAIAILLVIFGHSIIIYSSGWNLFYTSIKVPFLNQLKEWINIIQMPLFISISGYLYYCSKRVNLLTLLKKKAKRLLIPFMLIGIFWMIPIRILMGYRGYKDKSYFEIIVNGLILGEDSGHLWFIPFLFFAFIFFYIQNRMLTEIELNNYIKSIILILIGWIMYYQWWKIPSNIPGGILIRNLFLNYLWFVVGYVLCEYQKLLDTILGKIKWIIIGGAVISSGLYIGKVVSNKILTTLLLLIMFYLVVPNKKNFLLQKLSLDSFGIYLFHSPLVYITYATIANENPMIVVGINFIFFGILSIILTHFIRRTVFKICIGE